MDRITKRAHESLKDYLSRVATSSLTVQVKLADMRHNSAVHKQQNKMWRVVKTIETKCNVKGNGT